MIQLNNLVLAFEKVKQKLEEMNEKSDLSMQPL